jgi:hypothetical protein
MMYQVTYTLGSSIQRRHYQSYVAAINAMNLLIDKGIYTTLTRIK